MSRWSLVGHVGASIIVLVLVGEGIAESPPTDSRDSKSPSADPRDIEGGRQLVRAYCTSCHGLDAKGARAPDLTQRVLRHGNSDEALSNIIRNGIPGTGMTGFAWWPSRHVRKVVSFLQHQRSSQAPSVIPGDAQKGKEVFEKQRCSTCHWTGPTGGRRGPDLSTSRGPLEYVRQALVDPAADIDRQYQQVVLVTKTGRILQGMRLSEDSFYIQLIDERDRLYTIAKADIDQLERPSQSLMPSYEKELSSEELDNLIAYLFSLRKE